MLDTRMHSVGGSGMHNLLIPFRYRRASRGKIFELSIVCIKSSIQYNFGDFTPLSCEAGPSFSHSAPSRLFLLLPTPFEILQEFS